MTHTSHAYKELHKLGADTFTLMCVAGYQVSPHDAGYTRDQATNVLAHSNEELSIAIHFCGLGENSLKEVEIFITEDLRNLDLDSIFENEGEE